MISVRHPASFRDPSGYVVNCGARLLRIIRPEFVSTHQLLLNGSWLQRQSQSGKVASFRILENDEAIHVVGAEATNCLCLEHDVIGFPSFPSEWTLEMMSAAATHTLELCLDGLSQDIGIKDATPFNILFRGPNAVFVDLLSFESRDIHDPIWLAYGQFIRSFLLPVLMDARYGMSCHATFLAHKDGIEPEVAYRFLSPLARFTVPFLGYVTMPVLLAAKAERDSKKMYFPRRISNAEKAKFILKSRFASLSNLIKVSSIRRHQVGFWTHYDETCSYTALDHSKKTAFVEQFLQSNRPAKVLDVGCNTGHFSLLAAQSGAEVVAIDLDPEVVGRLWQRAKSEQANILPLVVNLARPTPASGWRNRETTSFLERAEGYFAAVLMLAIVHHLLVADQIPLGEIIEQAYKLTTQWLVIEYVGPEDHQFKRLLRGRDTQYHWFHRGVFETELGRHFEIVQQEEIANSGRWLYLASRRNTQ